MFIFIFALLSVAILSGSSFLISKILIGIYLPINPAVRLLFFVIPELFTAGFILTLFSASKFNNGFTEFFYFITASWIGFAFYILLAGGIFWLLKKLFGSSVSAVHLLAIGQILLMAALLTGIYGIFHAKNTRVTILNKPIANIPVSWQGKKAVWFSDAHLGQINGRDFLAKTVEKIKAVNPDIVFIGGDLYDGMKVNIDNVIEPLKELKPPMGIFFITGNHEEFSNPAKYIEAVRNAGIMVLNNQSVNVDGVNIIGVDYQDTANKTSFDEILKNLTASKNGPAILLRHEPDFLDIAEKYKIDLQISGHTHRAQLWPLNIFTYLVYGNFDYGFHKIGLTALFTSDGVGAWGPPMRVLTNSEIVEIDF